MNFKALKIILQIHKSKEDRSRPDILTMESTSGLINICRIREKSLNSQWESK